MRDEGRAIPNAANSSLAPCPLAPPMRFPDPLSVMRRAFELAARGQGFVEPNPMVVSLQTFSDC